VDIWLLQHPGMAVNMVSKVQGRMRNGVLDVPERYQPYFYPDGAVKNAALYALGWDEANRMRNEMLHGTFLVDRDIQNKEGSGWLQEAQRLVQGAARRDIERRWEALTGRPWTGKLPAGLKRKNIPITDADAAALRRYGEDVIVEPSMTGEALFNMLDSMRGGMAPKYPVTQADDLSDRDLQRFPTTPAGSQVPSGAELYRRKEELVRRRFDELGITSVWDLPDSDKDLIREFVYMRAIELGYTTAKNYSDSGYDRIFGPIDIDPPQLTEVGQMGSTLILDGEEIRTHVEVVDGDTVNIVQPDGTEWTIRIQGVNAPDRGQYMWQESADDLQFILDSAQEIAFGTFEPERYGSVMLADPSTGRRRARLFLIADGVPIIDTGAYTTNSPYGVDSGVWGYKPPIKQIYMDGSGMVERVGV
jgi:endonuclease YncB( thermonuclease family)